ncbi:hypothetical protein [Flavobacterium sp.]|uniref:hypothetical protein n=1 Tax=Flavobacterium sp. TaxID=239 RepID=UPI0035B44A20
MRKQLITVTLFLFFTIQIPAKTSNIVLIKKSKNNSTTNKHLQEKDSIVISIQHFDEITKLFKKDDNIMKSFLPSGIALIVVIISTYGAVYIGKKQIQFQIKNGEEQLRSQEAQSQEQLNVAREQLHESSKIALKQIVSNSRQEWVNETRHTISELITQINLLNIEFQEKNDFEKKKIIHEKLTYNKNKILLLLKPSIEQHKALLDSIKVLMSTLDMHLLNSNSNNITNVVFIPYNNEKIMTETEGVIINARNLLYEEWGKIQS